MELQKQNDGFVEVALPTLADTDSVYNLWETNFSTINLDGRETLTPAGLSTPSLHSAQSISIIPSSQHDDSPSLWVDTQEIPVMPDTGKSGEVCFFICRSGLISP